MMILIYSMICLTKDCYQANHRCGIGACSCQCEACRAELNFDGTVQEDRQSEPSRQNTLSAIEQRNKMDINCASTEELGNPLDADVLSQCSSEVVPRSIAPSDNEVNADAPCEEMVDHDLLAETTAGSGLLSNTKTNSSSSAEMAKNSGSQVIDSILLAEGITDGDTLGKMNTTRIESACADSAQRDILSCDHGATTDTGEGSTLTAITASLLL